MLLKMKSFSHTNYSKEKFRGKEWIVSHVRVGKGMRDRWGQWYDRDKANRDFPMWLDNKANEKRFAYMLDKDGERAGFVDYVPGVE
jgi:beta-1,4-mannosyl-glycoprotein beta-1,4-N-acetylglucosaminyltransferase